MSARSECRKRSIREGMPKGSSGRFFIDEPVVSPWRSLYYQSWQLAMPPVADLARRPGNCRRSSHECSLLQPLPLTFRVYQREAGDRSANGPEGMESALAGMGIFVPEKFAERLGWPQRQQMSFNLSTFWDGCERRKNPCRRARSIAKQMTMESSVCLSRICDCRQDGNLEKYRSAAPVSCNAALLDQRMLQEVQA